MAAQLTLINGPAARGLQAWMTSASTSLPTPLSPVIRMRLSEAAISDASWNTACMSGLLATTCAGSCLSVLNFRRAVLVTPVACCTVASSSSRSIGLAR